MLIMKLCQTELICFLSRVITMSISSHHPFFIVNVISELFSLKTSLWTDAGIQATRETRTMQSLSAVCIHIVSVRHNTAGRHMSNRLQVTSRFKTDLNQQWIQTASIFVFTGATTSVMSSYVLVYCILISMDLFWMSRAGKRVKAMVENIHE